VGNLAFVIYLVNFATALFSLSISRSCYLLQFQEMVINFEGKKMKRGKPLVLLKSPDV
jgi:hypothetical protein